MPSSAIMAQFDLFDIVILSAVLVGTVAFFSKGTFWGKKASSSFASGSHANGNSSSSSSTTRSIVEKLESSDRQVVVFYGSQTGTAEDYASRLAKEGHSRFGLKTMVADLEEYDLEDLDTFPSDKLAIFVMATYGEGEPTDNAAPFYEFITDESPAFSNPEDESAPLANLKYVAFGLGNNTYEHYNAVIKILDEKLSKLGAFRIGDLGLGDDGAGTLEEDFLSWKDKMWEDVGKMIGLEEREATYEPVLNVAEIEDLYAEDESVYVGEFNKQHLEGAVDAKTHSANNPYIAPVTVSREIFNSASRNCLHIEVDLSGSNLKFTTGDHIAVWPQNSEKEVDRFLTVLGLIDKRHTVIDVTTIDPTAKVPFPTPTTYDAVVRYHLEICGVVSRQFLNTLAGFAPSDEAKAELAKIGSSKELFAEYVTHKHLNIAQLLEKVSNGQPWTNVPFSLVVETINHLQPRYYSISSSSYIDKTKPTITVVVESIEHTDGLDPFKGVASNYLLDLKYKMEGVETTSPSAVTYAIEGPRKKFTGFKLPVHIRHSNFKLPSNPATPIIMVGPGTGVAPFRAFIHERAAQAEAGVAVGESVLFFGSRNRTEDFLYREEWEETAKKMPFKLVTAFSREGPEKVYVQHRLLESAELVNKLLLQGAYFYVCGDAARMAKDVSAGLAQIISTQRGISLTQAEDIVKSMRSQNTYQEDVW
ncbi:NADPH-cytochrome P450 reductase [Myxozyma melibiosi]|uniref:NADPH--cytochrome P450 reductase n=1 Tax=Myxozyma melibiosi TaxID=54550 RepID=A0ABR1F239_9ASCO